MTRLPAVGNHCMPSWDIGFEDVDIPADALMGEPGQGLRNMGKTLAHSRTGQAALAIGLAQAACDAAKTYVIERRQFGQRIADFQVIRHRLVDMQTRVDQARLLLYYLCWLLSAGKPCRKETAQLKIVATETLEAVSAQAMHMTASFGYSQDTPLQRYWRDGRLFTFGEGANELQRDFVAREIGL
jgi:alkylation response protein AidB-like acyl-CoA dehydrogenase